MHFYSTALRRIVLQLTRTQLSGTAMSHHNVNTCSSTFPTVSGSTLTNLQAVKLITFDITGTLLTFKKPPLEIYGDFGKKHGIHCDLDSLKTSFKTQWKRMTQEKPHFGSCWEDWWTQIVIGTFQVCIYFYPLCQVFTWICIKALKKKDMKRK